jgi:hypothetical protein
MPQNNRSVTDAYWKKRYKDAGVVPTGNGVRVTKPTSRVAVDNTWDARAKQSWLQNNYDPIATAIEKGNPNVVQSSVLDTARYGLQQGLLSQTQYDWVSKSIETMRKRMATTPVTSGGQSIPFGKWGLPDATKPGEFGPVQKPLMYSDLIQYNKDGSWGFTAPQSGAQVNQVTGVNKQRMDALMQNAQPINAGVETAANLGYGALGTAAALPLGLAYAAGYNGTNDPNSTWGRIESTAQGVLAGVPLAVSNAMSGVTANTSYLGGRMAGLSPEVANQRADTITQQSPWYQFSNEASAPGIENGDFQLGTTIGKELTTAVPAMYASLGLLNASASLGGRLLAPFGTQASSVGRMAGLGTAVVAPPLMTGFRDQLTGGKSGIREDIIAGIETLSDPIRSPQQRGMSENERIAQQEFDPEGKVAGAFQQAGVLAMASGGASQMWRDVVSNAKKGMWEFRGALKETNNPFKASGAGIGALVENEIGRAAMTDLGFATTQPLGDIGRKIYAQMRYDKSKPYEEPTWGDIFKSFALGLVASRPGQKAQWIFRGNPLSSLDPKTMAMAHAVDIVNQGTPEVSALREHIRSMRPDGLEPNETDIRRVASAMAADNNANIAQTRRAGTLPEGTRVFRTNAEYVADYLKNPELYPEEVRTKYDAMFDNVRSESDEVNIDDENVLNKIPVSPEYDTDLALRKRRIANLTDRLIPHYTEMLKQTTESGTDKPLPPSRYYGIDLGDGNMIVYNSNFDSAIMMPLKESPDIVMLKEQRISDTNHTYDHEERLQAYDAFEELMRLHGDAVKISLRRVVPIGFSADGLVVRTADG